MTEPSTTSNEVQKNTPPQQERNIMDFFSPKEMLSILMAIATGGSTDKALTQKVSDLLGPSDESHKTLSAGRIVTNEYGQLVQQLDTIPSPENPSYPAEHVASSAVTPTQTPQVRTPSDAKIVRV